MNHTKAQLICPTTIYRHLVSAPQAKNLKIQGKSVLITGGNCGIGRQTVLAMARNGVKSVTIVARNEKTALAVIGESKNINPSCEFEFVKLDLGDQKEIMQVVENELQHKYDVIIGNSGVWPGTLRRTKDDFELGFGVNHLGHFTLINHYLNTTKHVPERITLTSSIAHLDCPNGIRFEDPNFETTKFTHMFAYGQSKLANILYARKLAEKLKGKSIVNHIHPGVVASELWRELLPKFMVNLMFRSEKDGCQSILHAAFSESVGDETGVYYSNCENSEQFLGPAAKSEEQADKLWDISVELTGVDLEC